MPVDPLNIFTLPLILALAAIFALAAIYDFITFRRRKNRNQSVYRCGSCRHIYTAQHRIPLARCPKCGKQNEPVRE